jgi:hypothetical protein
LIGVPSGWATVLLAGVPSASISVFLQWLIRRPDNPIRPARSDHLDSLGQASASVRAVVASLDRANFAWYSKNGRLYLFSWFPLLTILIGPFLNDQVGPLLLVAAPIGVFLFNVAIQAHASSTIEKLDLLPPPTENGAMVDLSRAHQLLELSLFLAMTTTLTTLAMAILVSGNVIAGTEMFNSNAQVGVVIAVLLVAMLDSFAALGQRIVGPLVDDSAFQRLLVARGVAPEVHLLVGKGANSPARVDGRLVGIGRELKLEENGFIKVVPWSSIDSLAAESGVRYLYSKPSNLC